MSPTAFGRHVKYVCLGADPTKLRHTEVLRGFLMELCVAIGMRPLGDPDIHDVEEDVSKLSDPQQDEGGLTGSLVLSTSHMSFHAWPLRDGLIIFDVFSCRDFDPAVVPRMLRQTFAPAAEGMTISLHDVSHTMACPTGHVGPISFGPRAAE